MSYHIWLLKSRDGRELDEYECSERCRLTELANDPRTLRSRLIKQLYAIEPRLTAFHDEFTDENTGIQIMFYDDHTALVDLPLSDDSASRQDKINRYLELFAQAGFVFYDPQNDIILGSEEPARVPSPAPEISRYVSPHITSLKPTKQRKEFSDYLAQTPNFTRIRDKQFIYRNNITEVYFEMIQHGSGYLLRVPLLTCSFFAMEAAQIIAEASQQFAIRDEDVEGNFSVKNYMDEWSFQNRFAIQRWLHGNQPIDAFTVADRKSVEQMWQTNFEKSRSANTSQSILRFSATAKAPVLMRVSEEQQLVPLSQIWLEDDYKEARKNAERARGCKSCLPPPRQWA